MNWDIFQQTQRLRWKLPLMRYCVRNAERILVAFLKRCENPYVAFSTGKDSLVAMDIALRIRPDIQIVWHDEDWVLPGTAENIEGVETFYGINIIRVRERFSADEFFKEFGRWPICLSPRSVDFEADHWFEIVRHYGWDGAVIALRSDESTQRYFALKRPLRWNKSREEWRVSPVHDWSVEDIWAYILGRKLPYHPAYEKMIDAGIEPKFARIGPLTAVRVYDYGILTALKQLWPETWNRFVEENPCVAAE